MKIVKLSSLSKKERKKVLEEQEERYIKGQQESKRLQQQANEDFMRRFGDSGGGGFRGGSSIGSRGEDKNQTNLSTSSPKKNISTNTKIDNLFTQPTKSTTWSQIQNLSNNNSSLVKNNTSVFDRLQTQEERKNSLLQDFINNKQEAQERIRKNKEREEARKKQEEYDKLHGRNQKKKIFKGTDVYNDNLRRFNNGYQFGDIYNTLDEYVGDTVKVGASTVADWGLNIGKGIVGVGENLGNAMTGVEAQLFDWAGNKEYAERLRRNIASNPNPISKAIDSVDEKLDRHTIMGEKGDEIAQNIGYMGALMAGETVGGPLLTNTMTFGSSLGSGLAEGYANPEATNGQVWASALGGAGIETFTENLFGMFGHVDEGVTNAIAKKIKSGLGKQIARLTAQGLGEGAEEFISYGLNYLKDRFIDKASNGKGAKFAKDFDVNEVLDQAGTAFLTSTIMGGGSTALQVQNVKKANNVGTREAVNILGRLQDEEASQPKIKKSYKSVEQENLKQQNQKTTQQANKDIDQEIKTSQNGFSQAEKTEALRQEARNKLESIKQNYDENSYNQMQEFIETAPNEKALNQVINDLNKETETKQVAPLKQKQEVQLPMKQETQNKSFEDVAFEAMNTYESNEVESPLKNRDMDSIGKQTKVNAYQYDNPQVKPYFQEMAQQMGEDLAYISSSDNRSTQKGGGTKLSATTKAMDILHNEQGYSYNQIAQGLQNIIDDKGSENNAISKKIELVIDEQLRNGYTNALGKFVEPNQEYINNITEQYSLAEQAPQNNFKYEKTDNQKVNTLYESTSKYFDDSEKTHNMLKPMEKIIRDKGYNITFDDTIGDNVNGRIRTNENGETEITINPNSNRKGEFIIGHELTHAIETQEMVDLVKKRMEKDGELRNAVEDLKKLYGTDDINGEVLADISGQLFGNQEFINNLSVEKPSVFKRIYDAIVSLANKITGNSSEALFLKDLKNKWEKAYRENNNKFGEAQYSFAGIKSKTVDIDKLNEAIALERSGASQEEIYEKTGFYKGNEGKWRYEIGNENASIATNLKGKDLKFRSDYEKEFVNDAKEKIKLADNQDKLNFWKNELEYSSENLKVIDKINLDLKNLDSFKKAENFKLMTNRIYLSDILKNNEELFKAYPFLNEIEVGLPFKDVFDNKEAESGTLGYVERNNFDDIPKKIFITKKGLTDNYGLKKILLHEIQHAIQSYEGFSNGADNIAWQQKINREIREKINKIKAQEKKKFTNKEGKVDANYGTLDTTINKLIETRIDLYNLKLAEKQNNADKISKILTTEGYFSQYAYEKALHEGIDKAENLIRYYSGEKLVEKIDSIYSDIIKSDTKAFKLYKNTAGEIEAREVEKRAEWSEEKRKNKLPFIKNRNTVYFENYLGDYKKPKSMLTKKVENTNKITNAEYSLNKDGAMKDNKTGKKVTLQAESMNDGKNLLAIHNLDESKLKGVLELGGFPVPSIAITNPDIVNHSQFGDISVIFNKNTINPEIDSRNEVYDRDVWSPTFPRVDYDISNSTIKDYITKGLQYDYKDDIISSAVTNYMYDSNLLDRIDRNGFEETLKDLKNSKELKYFYKNVVEKGEYSPKTKPLRYNKNYSNETLQRFIDLFDEDMDLADFYYHYMNYQDMQMSDEQRQKLKDNIKKAIEPEIENEIKEDLEKKPNLTKEEQEKYRKALYEIETDWIENRPYELREFVANASQYSKNGEAQTIDREATLNDISNYVNQEQFENWVDDSFGKMFKDAKKGIRNNKEPYTPSGNLRSFNQLHEDYNLQNVVNYMIAQDTKGGEGGFMSGGFGEIQAKQGNKFNSISDIKANEDRLVISEEASKQLEPLKDNIHDDIEKLSSYYKVSSSYYNNSWENSANAISEFSGKSKLTEANLKKVLDSYYNFDIENIPKEVYSKIIKDLNNLKNITTDYFEAKPQRAVGFDEIDAIVIPKDVSKEVKQQLKDRGIKTIEYDRNNENERADILKSLNEYKFSKTSKSWQDYLEKNYKSKGTTTDLRDIRLPMKEKQEVKAPLKQGNVQQNQNNNTPGENINWNEIERPEDNQKFRKHYRSIIESSNTTAEAKAVAKELMGRDTYEPETNKGQLAQADQRIMTSSPEVELQSLLSRAMNGEKISSVDIAVGERLIQYFSKTGNKQQLQDAIQATAMAGTSAGQTVQALSMLNHQTPQGQATWIQRSVDKMNKELAKKKGGTITTDADGNLQVINKQGVDITNKVDLFNLTPEMIDKIMNSENQEQMYKNIDEVYEELGQQVPLGTLEKIDSWRYFSMLANPTTHIRNMVGNVAMGKMQRAKDKLAGGIEDVVSKFNPKMERTKTLRRADAKTKDFAKQDFKNMEVQSRLELNENKYNPQSRLQNARRTFKSNAMENTLGRLFNLNDKLLSAEDGIGLKAGYQKALADYITANKIDVDNITDAQLNKARNYAVQQAKEATFHQANAIASAISTLENKNIGTKLVVGGLLPFKKTPMNIAKAGVEYSPLQIAKSITYDYVNLRKGNISINQYIDNLSKGLTGTGVALVGYALANAGILKASGDEDKDKEKYDEDQGKQSYSIQIGGKTYSLDWLAPTGIPLFVGAEAYKLFNQESKEKSTEKSSEDDKLEQAIKGASNLLNAGATAINPMSEMSMISGLTNALSSYNSDGGLGKLGNVATNIGKSYINQFVPTMLGKVAKTTDEYERTTKSTAKGTLVKAVDQTINQIKAKVPGLRQTLPIKTDIWGNDMKQEVNLPLRAINNFVNPATVKNVSTDKVDMELNKLYEENHSSSLLPDILTKTVQLNKQTYRLSNKEYAEFTKNYGQTSHKLIENFIKTSDYNKLTQEQKETAISNIYSYAKEQNKMDYAKKVNETVKPSTLYTTMKEIEKNGGKQSEYLSYLAKTKGMSKESEKNKVLADSNYSNRTKEIIYTNGTGKDDNLYNNLLSKSHINMTEYLDYKDKVSNKVFSADKDKNGKTVTGSAKAKVINYLNNNITGVGNRLLIAGKSYALQNNEKQKLAQYINSIANTREERIEIYKQLDKNFYVRNGKVYMRVSK